VPSFKERENGGAGGGGNNAAEAGGNVSKYTDPNYV
jgi:hypothetical protein